MTAKGSAQDLPFGAAECLAELDRARFAEDTGPDEILYVGDYCPELAARINGGVWGEALAEFWADDLSARELEALIGITERYGARSARVPELALTALDAAVAELEPFVPIPEESLWDKLTAWLDDWLGTESSDDGWLTEWLRSVSIPDAWAKPIVYLSGAVIVLTVLFVLVNELRHGGVFGSRPVRRRLRETTTDAPGARGVASFAEIRRAPASRQAEMVFALVLDRLRQRYRALISESMTHRELASSARGLDGTTGESLRAVADAAERVTYAGWEPAAEELVPVLAHGERFVRALDADESAGA